MLFDVKVIEDIPAAIWSEDRTVPGGGVGELFPSGERITIRNSLTTPVLAPKLAKVQRDQDGLYHLLVVVG